MILDNIGDLKKHLEQFPDNTPLIVDVDGNTFNPTTDDINWWDSSNKKDSPVAIMTMGWLSDE